MKSIKKISLISIFIHFPLIVFSYSHSDIYRLFQTDENFLKTQTLKINESDPNIDAYFYTNEDGVVSVYVKLLNTDNYYLNPNHTFKVYYFTEDELLTKYGSNWPTRMSINEKYFAKVDNTVVGTLSTPRFGELIETYNLSVSTYDSIPIDQGILFLMFAGVSVGLFLLGKKFY